MMVKLTPSVNFTIILRSAAAQNFIQTFEFVSINTNNEIESSYLKALEWTSDVQWLGNADLAQGLKRMDQTLKG